MLPQFSILLISLSLGGCFYAPVLSKGKVSTLDQAPRMAATVSTTESKAIAAYDPASKVATTIPAPSGALSGSSVTLPPGALALAVELVVEEAVPLSQTSVASSLAISSDISIKPVGSGLIIRPTENVDLTRPLTIAMPIDPTAGLRARLVGNMALTNGKYYTVFYKYFVNGDLKAGAIATSDLRFSDTGSVLFEGYFGAYWLAEVSAPIQEKLEVITTEPIVNKDNVSVVTSTGVVTETEVLAKASIPTVEWLSVTLALDAAQRMVTATASIAPGRTLNACQVDLFESTEGSTGLNIDAASSMTVMHKLAKQEAHTLYARFRCLDDQGRQSISFWSSAVSIPGVAPTPTVTPPGSNFCASPAPELRLVTTQATATYATSTAFTALGGCVYTAELDTLGGMAFGIHTADGKIRCMTNEAPYLGEPGISCAASTDTSPGMWLPQGNYTIKLDFSISATAPRMTISHQPCNLGDLYLLTTSDPYTWPAPTAANRMSHLGGCQYTAEAMKINDAMLYVRMQNLSGTYVCGDNSGLSPHTLKPLSCGSTTPGYFMLSAYSSYIAGFRYLLNLGQNLDINGQATTASYLWASEIDKCMENRYILGPTTAGNNRQPGVNSFMKYGGCSFNYSWIQTGASFSSFFIGVGEGSEKCGVAPATSPSTNVYLDCSASAVPIDMQAFVSANGAYRLNMQTDSNTGRPSYLDIQPVNLICMDPIYAVKNGTTGFRPNLQTALTEISECIYQYDWTPTAGHRNLSFVQGNNLGIRCAKFPEFVNPSVGGPATDFACRYNSSTLGLDYPFSPSTVADGVTYKVNLDFRLGYDRGKISLASHTALACPDLHVLGLPNMNENPDAGNLMTRTGDCNYSFKFKTGLSTPNSTIHIANNDKSMLCARDNATGNLDPSSSGQSVAMACSGGAPNQFSLALATDSHYQITVHYDSGGGSRISVAGVYQNCGNSVFSGPAALDQNTAFSKNLQWVENCVEEMVWAPTSSSSAFRLQSNYYGYASVCGTEAAGAQTTVNGAPTAAICNIFNVASASNFTAAGGVTAGSQYLVRLDRSLSPFDAPKLSIQSIHHIYTNLQGTHISGSQGVGALSSNTVDHPGGRWSAAVWSVPGSPYRYMLGGFGYTDASGPQLLADLWRYDTDNDVWTLLPNDDFGTWAGSIGTMGAFAASHRPSARQGALAVYDPSGSGKLWLFGGEGINSAGNQTGTLNDLWVYDLGLQQWALMSGNPAGVNLSGAAGDFGVPAHSNLPGGRMEASGFVDASGKIYVFGGLAMPDSSSANAGSMGRLNDLWVFDPADSYANSSWTWIGGSHLHNHTGSGAQPSARQGAIGWKAANGHFWLFGGFGSVLNPTNGTEGRLNDLWSYNPTTNVWTRRGGADFAHAPMNPGLRGIRSQYIWPAARVAASAWQTPDGKFWMLGGDGLTGKYGGSGSLSDVWTFDPSTLQWTWVSGFTQYMGSGEIPAINHWGEYGPLDITGNYQPGARMRAVAWPDSLGNVFIFGGLGYSSYSTGHGYLNDLWHLDF